MEEIEIWKPITGYSDYEASNLGNIRSLKFKKIKVLNQFICSDKGYYKVDLYMNGKSKKRMVHILIAIAFLDYKPDNTFKLVCDHKDNNPLNNKLSNLQIVTNRVNCSKDRKRMYSQYIGVTWHIPMQKWLASIKIDGKKKHLGYFDDEIEASNTYQQKLLTL